MRDQGELPVHCRLGSLGNNRRYTLNIKHAHYRTGINSDIDKEEIRFFTLNPKKQKAKSKKQKAKSKKQKAKSKKQKAKSKKQKAKSKKQKAKSKKQKAKSKKQKAKSKKQKAKSKKQKALCPVHYSFTRLEGWWVICDSNA